MPAPTPYASNPVPQPQPTRTIPMQQYNPPAPQPGAVPVPLSQQAPSTLPPPPKAGEAAAQRQNSVTTAPPQMSVPRPQQNYAPTHSTDTSTSTMSRGGPTTINFGAVAPPPINAGSNPPGYYQNVNAQEMSSTARASLENHERRESLVPNLGLGGDSTNEAAANMWNTVKDWANTAGNTLAGAHEEVWKRIENKK